MSLGEPSRFGGVRSTHYRRGAVLWHGTSADVGFRDLKGPAWVSDSIDVARWFATWHLNAPQTPSQVARVVKYVVDVPFSLPTFDQRVEGRDKSAFDRWLRRVLAAREPAWRRRRWEDESKTLYVDEAVEMFCALGYEGWRIVLNYETGDDIMLCNPEKHLRRERAGKLWKPE